LFSDVPATFLIGHIGYNECPFGHNYIILTLLDCFINLVSKLFTPLHTITIDDDKPRMDPAPPSSATSSTHSKVTPQHYEAHADNDSYEDAYFYEPGAYMDHLVKLHVDCMGLRQTILLASKERVTRRILDIGGGTGNFAQALVQFVAKEDDASVSLSKVDHLDIVVVDPFLDPTTSSKRAGEGAATHRVSFVKAGAEAFLDNCKNSNDQSLASSSWRAPGSYHQILMKEIVHHLDAKDRVGIFRGMHQGLANVESLNHHNNSGKNSIPSILIVTRPQVEIDYPLWDKARQVWKENQPSVHELTNDLHEAGFRSIKHTIESYPCSISLERWQSMIKNRFWSTFSSFSDKELQEACHHLASEYSDRIDDEGVIHFEDRLVFLIAHK
jgi:hypothetical protein